MYFCVVRVDGLWRLEVCECCVRLDVGDESALFVLSVCADGSVVWYLGCRDVLLSFDSCTVTTSGCDVSSRCFSSSTVLLIPFALSCRIFISLCLVLFVVCVGVCRSVDGK